MGLGLTRPKDLEVYDPETDLTPVDEIVTVYDHYSWPKPKRAAANLVNQFYNWAESSLATLLGLLGVSESKWNEIKAMDLSLKVDKVDGYGLSKNDLTDELKAKLDGISGQNVFTIEVPSGDVSERAPGATVKPAGWTLAAAANPNDLQITHNLGRKFAHVTVSYVDGIEQVLLMGNLGYTGISAPSANVLVIKGLSTKAFPLTIQLIFA